jgi:N-acetyl-anhydromuramyl-L-alanine amidase AmpD
MLTYRLREKTTAVVLHDSHTPPSQSDVQHFLAVGGREKGLLDIGYHFLILRDGGLVECRPHRVQGTHLRSKLNRDTIGVCLAGGRAKDQHCHYCETRVQRGNLCGLEKCDLEDVPEDNFTPAQWVTLQFLMQTLAREYGRPLNLVGHNELDRNHYRGVCPFVDMQEVRRRCCP